MYVDCVKNDTSKQEKIPYVVTRSGHPGSIRACVWLNPTPEAEWDLTQSIRMMRQIMGGRMYPLTLEGLDKAMRELVR
jgi:uncharacterized protein with von Willebrand factor type A (vWA) domain